MKNRKIFQIIITIVFTLIGVIIGWYLGTSLSDNNSSNNQIENKVDEKVTKEEDIQEVSQYPEWMQYILDSDIESITIYKWMNETDKDYKENQNSLYTVEITKEELEEIFDSMKNVEYKTVLGMGGVDDYIKIVYNSNNNHYEFSIMSLGNMFNSDTDDKLNNLLRKEIIDFINNMTEEDKKLYGENPIPNMITNWDNSIIYTYFDKSEVSTYYYEK